MKIWETLVWPGSRCAKGQIKCSNTCTLGPFQNLFPFSYFLSLQLFLCQVFQCILIKGLFLLLSSGAYMYIVS